jgi:FKBP-type peptidyl-prolyl cis-trans isomerase
LAARAILFGAALGCASAPKASVENTSFTSGLHIDLAEMTKAGEGLYFRDIEVGNGALAGSGRRAAVRYSSWLPNGAKLETNTVPNDSPIVFELGKGQVIAGWERGMRGMRVGGKRTLVIAPSLGYGSKGTSRIPPNSVLVFEIELVRLY